MVKKYLFSNSMGVSQKLNIELPYDLEIPLLGKYPKDMKSGSWKDICTPMFIAALFTIVKSWKQPKCLLMDEWIKKMWHTHTQIHTIEYYSAIRRE